MAKIKPRGAWTREQRDNARAIMLEPSPYESDGGELIGRDPRPRNPNRLDRLHPWFRRIALPKGISRNPLDRTRRVNWPNWSFLTSSLKIMT
jgi:hypothetical protein